MSQLNTQLIGSMLMDVGDSIRGLAGTGAVITYSLFGVQAKSGNPNQFLGKLLAQGQLAVADGLIYSNPAGVATAVGMLVLSNTSALAVSGVKVSINGPASTAANQIISGISIPANGMAIFSDGALRVFDAAGSIQQTASAAAFDATAPAPTTPLIAGVVGTAVTAAHRDHQHQSPGGIASIVAASAGIVDTQVQVIGATIPAGLLAVGTVLRLKAFAFITSTVDNIATFRVRIGVTTLTGNIPASLAAHCGNGGTVTAAGVEFEVMLTIRTIGAGGTCYATGKAVSAATGAAVSQALANATDLFTPASVAVNTTVDNIVEFTAVTAAGTTTVTFQSASIEVVRM